MKLNNIKEKLNPDVFEILRSRGISELRPAQEKSINNGLFEGKNLLVCTPTASGKTLVGEMALLNQIIKNNAMGIYVAPLRSLANEKYNQFMERYNSLINIAISTGDLDSSSPNLAKYDLIVCTQEKLDSLLRHDAPWIYRVRVVVFDEIHILNDESRGPTLEIIITLLRKLIPKIQIIGLSATIGNPKELAGWLNAKLIVDTWRPVKLEKAIFYNDTLCFYKDNP